MANISGTNLASGVVPFTTEDLYATHESKYGKGGWREVATVSERDSISAQRRTAGMAVYVTETGKLYILNADLTTWTEFTSGGGTWGSITGTLSDQTDLQNALNAKQDTLQTEQTTEITLATVATSGSYTDLSNKPSIPTKTSDITNDSGYITKSVNNLDNYTKTSDLGDLALKDTVNYETEVTNKPTPQVVKSSAQPVSTDVLIWIDTSEDGANLITSDNKTFITSDNKEFMVKGA